MKYLLTVVLLLVFYNAQAQYDTIYLAIAPFQSATEKGQAFAKTAHGLAIDEVNADYRILRVDRDVANAVIWEREFQKSEDFIDSKIAEQGQAIGADYVFDGDYDLATKQLRLRIYNIHNGSLKCSAIVSKAVKPKKKKEKGALGKIAQFIFYDDSANKSPYPSTSVVRSSIKSLLQDCFPKKSWAVMRPTNENKSKVKEMLIAAGSRMGLSKGDWIEILVIHTEEVDGILLERPESVGSGKVLNVESDNFSIIKLESGEKNIKKLLENGEKLRCRTMKKR